MQNFAQNILRIFQKTYPLLIIFSIIYLISRPAVFSEFPLQLPKLVCMTLLLILSTFLDGWLIALLRGFGKFESNEFFDILISNVARHLGTFFFQWGILNSKTEKWDFRGALRILLQTTILSLKVAVLSTMVLISNLVLSSQMFELIKISLIIVVFLISIFFLYLNLDNLKYFALVGASTLLVSLCFALLLPTFFFSNTLKILIVLLLSQAIPIPAGIGIREILLIYFLRNQYSMNHIVAASIFIRFLIMVVETFLAALTFSVLKKKMGRRAKLLKKLQASNRGDLL